VTPAGGSTLAQIRAELARLIRYDDESIVHERWIRQRYDIGAAASYAPARTAAVQTAWHEAGHAVAALAVGARFSSASIRHSASRSPGRAAGGGRATQGRVHGISGGRCGELGLVIDAAGLLAERLRDWTLPGTDDELRAWLRTWKSDGGDARRFRGCVAARLRGDEVAAWRLSDRLLVPRRPQIRQVARALLVHPSHLPYAVVSGVASVT